MLSDIGSAFSGMECYSEALVHHEKAAELAGRIGDQNQLATAHCGMGDAYHGSGSYSRAIEAYEKAQRLAAEIEAPYLKAKALYGGVLPTVLSTRGHGAAQTLWAEGCSDPSAQPRPFQKRRSWKSPPPRRSGTCLAVV